ncbi:MAG TPA: ORF6N domain-containing protein [Planctomycetota bacterium]|nr:ORF6N domain-containing protein [Planctomycetota bacterium]
MAVESAQDTPQEERLALTDVIEVEPLIKTVRGHRVLLAADLARVYGVPTRSLNQAVKRNAGRFPPDFAFRLTRLEAAELQRSRSQAVTLKRGANVKYAPLAFTEHGAIMAASVLASPRAVQMSLFVVRAFVRLRGWVANQHEIAAKLGELERRVTAHDRDLQALVIGLRQLMQPATTPPRRIGFGGGSRADRTTDRGKSRRVRSRLAIR